MTAPKFKGMTKAQQAAARVAEREAKVKSVAIEPDADEPEADETDEVLSAAEQLEAMRLTREDVRILNRISKAKSVGGRSPGVRETLAALSLKVTMTQARPSREPQSKQPTIIYVVAPYGDGEQFIETEVREPNDPDTSSEPEPQDEE